MSLIYKVVGHCSLKCRLLCGRISTCISKYPTVLSEIPLTYSVLLIKSANLTCVQLANVVSSQYDTVNAVSQMDFAESLRRIHQNWHDTFFVLEGIGSYRTQVLKDKAQ